MFEIETHIKVQVQAQLDELQAQEKGRDLKGKEIAALYSLEENQCDRLIRSTISLRVTNRSQCA
jgi:hypothetical protein